MKFRGIGKRLPVCLRGRVPRGTKQDQPALLHFASDDLTRDLSRPRPVRKGQVLGPPQQHVAARRALHARTESTGARQPDQTATVLGAALDEKRCERHLS